MLLEKIAQFRNIQKSFQKTQCNKNQYHKDEPYEKFLPSFMCESQRRKLGLELAKIIDFRKQLLLKESQVCTSTRLSSFDNFAISNFTNQIWGTSITRSRTTKETKINPMKTIHKKTFLPSLFGLMLPLFLSESLSKSVFSLSDERTLLSMLKNSYQLYFQLESDNS